MFVLASSSPRRKELLSKIITHFKIIPSNIDESQLLTDTSNPFEIPEYLATKKAIDVLNSNQDDIVIGADTVIIHDNKIYGKPKNKDDAKKMLKSFSNKTHYVITGVCIASKKRTISFSSINEVTFYNLTDKEIESYLNSDEYKDKAGAYAIQGNAALFIKKINGDYNSIVGLPISEINRILTNFF